MTDLRARLTALREEMQEKSAAITRESDEQRVRGSQERALYCDGQVFGMNHAVCRLDAILASLPAEPEQQEAFHIRASYVLGGWERDNLSEAELVAVIKEGISLSPLGEVTIRSAGPWIEPAAPRCPQDKPEPQAEEVRPGLFAAKYSSSIFSTKPRRPQAETPACEHDIGEYGCPKCEPQAETPVDDEK